MFTKWIKALCNAYVSSILTGSVQSVGNQFTFKTIDGTYVPCKARPFGTYGANIFGNTSSSTSTSLVKLGVDPYNTTGSTLTISQISSTYSIKVGSDDTSPSDDDYNLYQEIVSGLSYNPISRVESSDSQGNPIVTFTFSCTNTSQSTITIREIGLFMRPCSSKFSSGVSNSAYLDGNTEIVLVERSVLATPLTLQPNESGTIVYELKYEINS